MGSPCRVITESASFISVVILILLVVLPATHAQWSSFDPLELQTPYGTIIGRYEQSSFGTARAFYGIPFALPPTGSRRFTYPEPYGSHWNNSFINGTEPSPLCFQSPNVAFGPFIGDEDCLYIDVWVPANSSSTEELPVLAIVPGGGYVTTAFQSGLETVAATQSIIVVYIHYRVNIFGFLSTAGLSRETSPYYSSGNYGVADWTLGLQWVHHNIALFGGDGNRITVYGASAGAWAMGIVQVTPKTRGLFQQIIAESGGSDQSQTVSSLERKEVLGQTLASAVGCPWDESSDSKYLQQNACLRNVSTLDLMKAYVSQNSFQWFDEHALFPAPDGWWLPDYPQTIYRAGNFHQVPILAGSALDEMNLIQYLPYQVAGQWLYNATNYDDVSGVLKNLTSLGANVSAVGALTDYYLDRKRTFNVRVNRNDSDTVGTSEGPYAAMVEISSGVLFQCPIRRNLRYQASAGQPAYGYTFGYRSPNILFGGLTAFAEHGSNIGLGINPSEAYLNDSTDASMVHAMQQYQYSFIINGDPNNHTSMNLSFPLNQSLPHWPSQTDSSAAVLRFGDHYVLQDANIIILNSSYPYCDLQDVVVPYSTYTPRCAPGHMLSNEFSSCV